ncbi:hypothetical protein LZ32DRAFT_601755 [Colletotrichum eremochloae]|nr:hypothetical protein LZ32DRAFT_601755 [Colletotrichum eremochloae]
MKAARVSFGRGHPQTRRFRNYASETLSLAFTNALQIAYLYLTRPMIPQSSA